PLDMGGMNSSQGFLDMLEAGQDTIVLSQAAMTQADAQHDMLILARMLDSPYFARIDFRAEGGETRPVYIGRATLMDKATLTIHVYDWRVPIASVFYRYGVGPAEYEAPAGIISGEVLLKRQYEIRRGELLYYFDANEHVLDSFLREMLSKPAAPAMKSIVETIQRDQDRIIRDMTADLLMVQGSAGSGKTSVALHRVAYLMYQGLQGRRLSPGDILILAPNATFERYISKVLPDLGEAQVRTMLFEDLLGNLLPDTRVEPRGAWVERWLLQE
ncbi:MAG TPA: helicase, partial [Clostridia bacterium]|nr:helicase [Clostridia bacterium]